MPALGIEPLGDGGTGETLPLQGDDPRQLVGVVAQLLEVGHRVDDFGGGAVTAGPVHFHRHLLGVVTHGDDDPLDELANDRLTLRRGGGRSRPQGRGVDGEAAYLARCSSD